ncbi:sporulation protein [Lentibacillus juripiscarius]|uniref:Sporulation protein n=1 Tax=Lentibacillus juripiscarius TaxID=257446 RepID=A0ABW5V6N4_9BACI
MRVIIIDNTLHYLRESLANTSEQDMTKQLIEKLQTTEFSDEEEFVKSLDEEEIAYLDSVVEKELNYARNANDEVRAGQLLEVYEQLF